MTRNTVMRTKLAGKDCGNPAMVLTLPEGKEKLLLGRLGGIAEKIMVRRTDPADDSKFSVGLAGTFRAVPADETKEIIESGILYLPDAFHNIVAGQLRVGVANEDGEILERDGGAENVAFAFDVYSYKAKNKAGYSWEYELLGAKAKNVLDDIFDEAAKVKQLGASTVKAIDHAKDVAAGTAKKK